MNQTMERTLKNVVAVIVAVELAMFFNLMYPIAAGIIAMLGILNTRRKAWKIGKNRFIGGFIAILISGGVYTVIGYKPLALGAFLALYLPLSVYLKSEASIVSNTVLSTHVLLYGAFDRVIIMNEIALLSIGVVIGIVAMIPYYDEIEKIEKGKIHIDETFRHVLMDMSYGLKNLCNFESHESDLFELEKKIKIYRKKSYRYHDNVFNNTSAAYIQYFEMRLSQIYRLMMMQEQFDDVFITQRESEIIGNLTEDIVRWMIEDPDTSYDLSKFEELRVFYRQAPLPKTRIEFEDRARLYSYFNNLEIFVSAMCRDKIK